MLPAPVVCPRCRGNLVSGDAALRCKRCSSVFPVVGGIPDLRVAPDPWIDFEADRAKGLAVDATAPAGLEPAVREYWNRTPGVPANDVSRHVDHELRASERLAEWIARFIPAPVADERWLDLGCGTAALAAIAPPTVAVSSIDVAFRWLMVAGRRFAGRRCAPPLFAANAEALPFADGAFDRVIALGIFEHCRELDAVLREVRRVLRPGGRLHVRTVNRYTLLREPHVGIWGVGWLPRAWADRFVRARGGTGYLHHWPRGAGSLARALRHRGFVERSVSAAAMLGTDVARLPRALRPVAPLYDRCRTVPVVGRLMRMCAPLLDASGVAP